MAWTSILAIYFLIWVMIAFIMLPFGVKTADEAGMEKVPGQADSAPVNFRPRKLASRATVIAAVLTTLYVLNYEYGWVGIEVFDILPKPPEPAGTSA
jgi:predicted secreted protein